MVYILPEIVIFIFSLFLLIRASLVKELNFNRNMFSFLLYFYLFLFIYSVTFTLLLYNDIIFSPVLFSNCYIICLYSFFMKSLVFLYYFIFIFILKTYYIFLTKNLSFELFFFFVLSSLFFCMILSSFSIFFLFLCFEGLTLISIAIVAIFGQSFSNLESLLNYFFISAVSSILFLVGLSFIFLDLDLNFCFSCFRSGLDNKIFNAGSLIDISYVTFEDLYFIFSNESFFFEKSYLLGKANYISADFNNVYSIDFISVLGLLLILFFFLIKLGLFPFHY